MRIAVTSDLHFHPPWYGTLKAFAERLQTLELDMLIIAGDLGEPLDMFKLCMKTYAPVCDLRAAMAGNHDVWHRAMHHSSQDLWDSKLSDVARDYDYHWLDAEEMVIGDLGIAGSIAWYDYSGRHPKVELSDDEYESVKSMISNDGNYIDWRWTDREFAGMVGEAFIERLDRLEAAPDIQDILVVTHVPLFDGTQRYKEDGTNRIIANAYYANITLGQAVLQREKVRLALSGHVHVERHLMVERGGQPPLPVYTNPSEYGLPAALIVDTDTWSVEIVRATDEV